MLEKGHDTRNPGMYIITGPGWRGNNPDDDQDSHDPAYQLRQHAFPLRSTLQVPGRATLSNETRSNGDHVPGIRAGQANPQSQVDHARHDRASSRKENLPAVLPQKLHARPNFFKQPSG
jgi:hypothetical protein